MNKKPYEPPRFVGFGSRIGTGQTVSPTGVCTSGPQPYEACTVGGSPHGTNPDCVTGALAEYPKCSQGSAASVTCIVGSKAGD